MRKELTTSKGVILVYVDGKPLFSDANDILLKLLRHGKGRITISSAPEEGMVNAVRTELTASVAIYKSKDGIFTICRDEADNYKLNNSFYYKINRE